MLSGASWNDFGSWQWCWMEGSVDWGSERKGELTPSSFAFSLADPSDAGFLHASSSFKSKAKPAQPQPTGEKQVLSRFGHLDPRNIPLDRWQSQ